MWCIFCMNKLKCFTYKNVNENTEDQQHEVQTFPIQIFQSFSIWNLCKRANDTFRDRYTFIQDYYCQNIFETTLITCFFIFHMKILLKKRLFHRAFQWYFQRIFIECGLWKLYKRMLSINIAFGNNFMLQLCRRTYWVPYNIESCGYFSWLTFRGILKYFEVPKTYSKIQRIW